MGSSRLGALACLLLLVGIAQAQNPFLFGDNDVPAAELFNDDEPAAEGETAPQVVIERVVSFPAEEDDTDVVVLRNVGGQTQDLTGWTLTDSDASTDSSGESTVYEFGKGEGCEAYAALEPSQKITLTPKTEENPCGFEFTVGIRDTISLIDASGTTVENVEWSTSEQGTAIRRMQNGTFAVLPETLNVLETLEQLGGYEVFLQAVEAAGLTAALSKATRRGYKEPEMPAAPPPPPIDPQFPAWFGFSVNRTALPAPPPPPPPPPPPKEGVPKSGPFTLLAPNNEAFDSFRAQIAGAGNEPLPLEAILKLPELKDILLYHILKDGWSTEYMKNNTGIVTTKVVEIVPFTDAAMGEGKILIHDSCVDKPTPDGLTCDAQAEFGKCYDPFMISPLGAQWQGGFCQRTCERCTCDPSAGAFCAEVGMADIVASNGVIHTINRLLFPPPKFEEVDDTLAKAAKGKKGKKGATAATAADAEEEEDAPAPKKKPAKKPKLTIGFKKGDEEEAEEAEEP